MMSLPTTHLPTEGVTERYSDLDLLDGRNLLERLLNDQQAAVDAVRATLTALESATGAAAERLARGGRLIYCGAGTSGRLSQLDATELTPTFSWPPERAVTLMAGGRQAFWTAVENAEDDVAAAERDFRAAHVQPDDVVIGVAASGTTPYVQRILELARHAGALTIGLANNAGTPVLSASAHPLLLDTGPEVLSGSTRLKAGTAQKITLNLFSTAVMVRLGKVYQNLMVDLIATNEKLRCRAVNLTARAGQVEPAAAQVHLHEAGWNVKTSVVMARLDTGPTEARALLQAQAGHLRAVLCDRPSSVDRRALTEGIVISCQARPDNPLHGPQFMRAMALAAQQAGASGIRANGTADIRAIRDACDLPIIGIQKDFHTGHEVYITPTFEAARLASHAGADIIAVDATRRARPVPVRDLIAFIHDELGKRVMADISTLHEAEAALELRVDYLGTTLSGYTPDSPVQEGPDVALVAALHQLKAAPVIAEGRIRTAEDIQAVRQAGAALVVVGTAVTNPREIARRLVMAWHH